MFGFVGALLAIPATRFVRALLQGRQETHFLVVLISGQGDSNLGITIPQYRQDENKVVEEQRDTPDHSNKTFRVVPAEASMDQE